MNPVRAFAAVFLAVFLLMLGGSILVTYLLPQTYRAEARVLAPEAAHLELFLSGEVLKQASEQLNLAETWAARYGQQMPLEDKRVEELLRRSVQVRSLPGTELVQIRAYGSSPAECAQLANEIARTGAAKAGAGTVRVIDEATPPRKPVRPNKPLNLVLGAVVGVFLGTMAGGIGAKLAVGFEAPRAGRNPASEG